MTTILQPHAAAVNKAAQVIQHGGLVAFPTETVYGLGACAFDAEAVARIFEVKRRPHFDPLIVHVAAIEDLKRVCRHVNDTAKTLIEHFWPGPLTLVLPTSGNVPDIVTSGLNTVAVRMPRHPVALQLIREAGMPVAAPSANLFGRLSPTTADHVAEQLGSDIDVILDGSRCPVGVESTIIDLSGEPTLLRPGGVSLEEITSLIGDVPVATSGNTPRSPGQLPQHYAPRTPLRILADDQNNLPKKWRKTGLLAFEPLHAVRSFDTVEVLSATGDLREAAARLFSCLHTLDHAGLDLIYAAPVPETGLGHAIMDRLRKAEGASCEKIF